MHYFLILVYGWLLLGPKATIDFVKVKKHSFFHHNEFKFPVSKKFGKNPKAFNEVIDALEEVYSSIVAKRGGKLIVTRKWSESTSNAYAWREGSGYYLEFPGGMARYPGMSTDGFALIACHEMGHLLGGYPSTDKLSYEGQADYFATMNCMRKILPYVSGRDFWSDNWMEEQCDFVYYSNTYDHNSCLRSLSAGLVVSKVFARLEGSSIPDFESTDEDVVNQSDPSHPYAQCRLDTYVAGALQDYRPRCWFKP